MNSTKSILHYLVSTYISQLNLQLFRFTNEKHTSFSVCTNNHFLRKERHNKITKESTAVSTERLEKNKTVTTETHETHS